MRKKAKMPRFNKFSVGRAAILFKKETNRKKVVEYYFERYGKKWNIGSPTEMEKFLFSKTRGIRPKFNTMFEGQKPEAIKQNFQKWIKKANTNAKRSSKRMKKLHQDPEYAKATAERMRKRYQDPEYAEATAERMRKLHQDPEFAKAHAKRASERMQKLNQDPEFAKARSERMKELHQDPKFAKAHAEHMKERMKELWAKPEWRKKQTKLISIGVNKYWGIVRSNMLFKQNAQQQTTIWDPRTKKWILATTKTPEKIALKKEQRETIQKSIQNLPSIEREIVVSHFFEGKNTTQISKETGLQPAQIEQNINSALKKLAKKLKNLL